MLVSTFVGSLRRGAYSQTIADTASLLEPEIEFVQPDLDLPAYNPDLEDFPELLPESVKDLRKTVEASDGLLFVTPEYNAGIPGFLKNTVDWISRPRESASIQGKPSVIVANSPSPFGGLWAAESLQKNLAIAGSETVAQITIGKVGDKIVEDRLTDPETLEEYHQVLESLTRKDSLALH